jgi:hypothetical protein
MAADTTILQGEVNEEPQEQMIDVERLLAGLMRSLLAEQGERSALSAHAAPGAALPDAPAAGGVRE